MRFGSECTWEALLHLKLSLGGQFGPVLLCLRANQALNVSAKDLNPHTLLNRSNLSILSFPHKFLPLFSVQIEDFSPLNC